MQLRYTAILLGLALCGVLAIGLPFVWKSSASETDYLFDKSRSTKPADVAVVEVDRAEPPGKYLFRRVSPQQWRMEGPVAARATDVDRVIEQTLAARKGTKGEPSRDLTQYKLAKPSLTVTLKKADGSTVGQLRLGSVVGPGTDARAYATSTERPDQAVPVPVTSLSALLRTGGGATTAGDLLRPANEFRSKTLLAEGVFRPEETVQTLTLQLGKGDKPNEKVVLNQGSDKVWRFKTPEGFGDVDSEGATAGLPGTPEATGLRGLLSKLTDGLVVAGPEDFVDAPKDLAEYGLNADNPELLRVEIARKKASADPEDAKEPITEVLLIGKKADEKGEKYFAKLEKEPAVVKVSGKAVDAFRDVLKSPSKLRSKDLVTLPEAKIDAVSIKVNSPEAFHVDLRKAATSWQLADGKGGLAGANAQAVNELLAALTKKGAVADFPPAGKPDAETGLDKPAVEVSLWTGGDGPPPADVSKAKTDPAAVKLLFGKKDKDVVYVRKESAGGRSDVLVPDSLFRAVTKAELEYLDPVLPSFEPTSVVKVVLAPAGGEATEVEQKDAATWAFKSPPARAGRAAGIDRVMSMLRNLAALSAKPFAREADAAFLARAGLEPPKLKVTVSVKAGDKTEDKVYLFGTDAADNNVYAKQAERPMVFLVQKSATVPFATPDLVDPTVFPGLELAKVKSVKFVGWANLTGAPFTLDLERKAAGDYDPRDPKPAFTVDGAKVENFLKSLVGLKAAEFLSHTGEVKPEYGLADPAALTIEIGQEGRPEPFTLTLGADRSGQFYGTAKQLPGDVFLLQPGKPDAMVKSAPAWFKK